MFVSRSTSPTIATVEPNVKIDPSSSWGLNLEATVEAATIVLVVMIAFFLGVVSGEVRQVLVRMASVEAALLRLCGTLEDMRGEDPQLAPTEEGSEGTSPSTEGEAIHEEKVE